MSGIVGGKNHRGSGLIADLGTDGQVLTSGGAGTRQIFEAAGGGVTNAKFTYAITSVQSNVTGDNTEFPLTGAFFSKVKEFGTNHSNGTFTAPEDGFYLFTGGIYVGGSANSTDVLIHLVMDNETSKCWDGNTPTEIQNNNGFTYLGFSQVHWMESGDHAHMMYRVTGTTKVYDLHGAGGVSFTHWSGVLLA